MASHQWVADLRWGQQRTFLTEVFSPDYDHNTVSWRFTCDSGKDYDFSKNVRLE